MRSLRTLLVVGILGLCAADVSAQSEGSFGVGVSVSAKGGTDERTLGHVNPGLLWRFGHGRNGWGWEYGLSWYSADLREPIEAAPADFGELHVRPFLGGYGYGRRIGRRTAVTARLLGGYALTSFELQPSFNDAYRRVRGADTVTTEVSNTFVVKPEVSAWVDLSRKIGLNVSLGYMVARPEVTVTSSLGRDARHVRADMLMFKVGAVYSIF
ncbi:MAG TPA: hypothetical protein VM032_03085 [Vicinamibacterales bacterium]|nr:hypothetical protein [Vicinamibacterales bacterium]